MIFHARVDNMGSDADFVMSFMRTCQSPSCAVDFDPTNLIGNFNWFLLREILGLVTLFLTGRNMLAVIR
jgi:hypothetical protein